MTVRPLRARANVGVPMPDGALLATDTYLPATEHPVPVLLLRTPYGKGSYLAEGLDWARRGFGFVVQDVRGRYDSSGPWEPYVHERADGAATLAWVAEQPWCSGSVILIGGSYASFTAWVAALARHPAARAVISLVPAVGTQVCYGPGGVLYLASHVRWWLANGDGAIRREGLFEAMYRAHPEVLTHLPVSGLGQCLWADLPTWFEPVQAGPDAVPAYTVTDAELAALELPALHVGGWYDGFVGSTLHQWRVAGSAVATRPARGLLIGPWTHELRTGQMACYGERRHGAGSRVPLGHLLVEWVDGVLRGAAPGSRAQVYVSGAERWDTAEDWPAGTEMQTWHAAHHGGLQRAAPAREGRDEFRYDPSDPFPSRCIPAHRDDLDQRNDAVRYLTPPLITNLELAGTSDVVLYAATDAPNTDWVARLLQVTPHGRRYYLAQGVLDASWAVGLVVRNQVRRYRIPLNPLAIELPAGHRLCLEITSSDFPDHARNLNTGADRHTTTQVRVAHQTVRFGAGCSTMLRLPVKAPA